MLLLGLDPVSRRTLWSCIKKAKQTSAIFLTTHSMEEAEELCDRLGIFVDGALRCIGNPKAVPLLSSLAALWHQYLQRSQSVHGGVSLITLPDCRSSLLDLVGFTSSQSLGALMGSIHCFLSFEEGRN